MQKFGLYCQTTWKLWYPLNFKKRKSKWNPKVAAIDFVKSIFIIQASFNVVYFQNLAQIKCCLETLFKNDLYIYFIFNNFIYIYIHIYIHIYTHIEMSCIYIKRKDIHKILVLYFDSLRSFFFQKFLNKW